MAETLCKCLKRFDDITVLLSGTSYPTANLFYQSFAEVKALIREWCTSENEIISKMADSMNTKFEKYWKKSNVALAVAYFLDPRYRKRGVEYLMRKVYGPLIFRAKVEEFVVVVKKIYESYAAASRKSDEPDKSSVNAEASKDDITEEDSDFQKFLYESNDGVDEGDTTDLDKYMSEPPLKLTKTISIMDEFDILSWWKINGSSYPVLSLIARDILAMQASTVASESAFSFGGRVVDSFRSRLDPEMVEGLICTKDWVGSSRTDKKRKVESILKDLEVAEMVAASITMEDLEEQEKQMSSDDED